MITIRQAIIDGVSWSGSAAAAFIALLVFTALSMLGMAVAGEALTIGNLSEVGWGALAWLGLSLAVTGYVSGTVASKAVVGATTRRAGILNGVVASGLVLTVLTLFSYSLISSALQATVGLAGQAAQAGAAGVAAGGGIDLSRAAERLGLQQEYRAVTADLSREDLERMLAESSPALNQRQISVAVDTTLAVLQQARRNLTSSIADGQQLGDATREQWSFVRNQLSGDQLVSRLETRGLASQEAQQVAGVIEHRAGQLEQNAEQALRTLEQQSEQIAEAAGSAATRAAASWLTAALLLVGFGAIGGAVGSDQHRGEELLQDEDYREQHREALHH